MPHLIASETASARSDTAAETAEHWVLQGNLSQAITCFISALASDPHNPRLHNNLGNAYQRCQQYANAIIHYQAAIAVSPDYAEAHHNLANTYALQHNTSGALRHYRHALHAAPDYVLAHYHLGLLFLKTHQFMAANMQFKNVITLCPNHPEAHHYLGILALAEGHIDTAEQAFLETLNHSPEHVEALVNLGVIALRREQNQRAIEYFIRALNIDARNETARNNLAATFMHHERFESALTHYRLLLEQQPNEPEYNYNAGVAAMELGYLPEAMQHFIQRLAHNPQHFETLINLSAIHLRINQREDAITYLSRAHQIKPDDAACHFMLQALLGKPVTTGCPQYARNLFDHYALNYDDHLTKTLQYTLPQHIARVLHRVVYNSNSSSSLTPLAHALDLGCGTGLTGASLRELCQKLTGVDISAKMLHRAREKNLYDTLIHADLITFFNTNTQCYSLIVAADVLPYVGALEDIFKCVQTALTRNGLWLFSIEISQEIPWSLQDTLRFSHHPQYINTLAEQSKFRTLHAERLAARQQTGNDLPVMLYLMQST